ncbi:DUF4381 domain-containing protein [Vibrio agarivorans]|uniref:DUF4381 domain-containing protein n=1 Tax=Vibrio agarivorans TaxID=153622 RepID=UPI0022319E08|nr:DUF4381 domain-containing protein [Vibrio agarivorans]MDN3659991.1 DUF4381 domain-containing protein [Vibrio agarivorans]
MSLGSQEHTVPTSYILRDLQDVVPTESVAWIPQTIGWKVLLSLFIVYGFYRLILQIRYWWINRYRQEATEYILAIKAETTGYEYELFYIAKQVLAHIEPGYRRLHGGEFISVLKQTAPNLDLDDDIASQWLASLNTSKAILNEQQREELKRFLILWLRDHQPITIGQESC